jgi:hypothetical protein
MEYKMITKKLSPEEEKALETVLEKESWLLCDEDESGARFFQKNPPLFH